MSLFESIVAQFNHHIDSTSRSLESMIPHIAEATHLLTSTLLAEKTIFCATTDDTFHAGHHLCHYLMHANSQQRPGLPALFLGNDSNAALNAIAFAPKELYARQILTLGQADDVLFMHAGLGHDELLQEALNAAHDKSMAVIAVLSGQHKNISSGLMPSDVMITLPEDTLLQTQLLHYMLSVIISNQVEQQLFGTLLT